ncbi:MAG: CinA family protein [Caldilineae bacterium]|nr:MAG: CinA family protein [Caldilineae bacterium]
MTLPPTLDDLVRASAALGRSLSRRGLTIGTAESCTGGLLASVLTDVSGSSAYVAGGVVAYSNEIKMGLLGVHEETLLARGAVSAETAAEMAEGALRLLGCDLALAITGIAGPGGGTAAKPVGLVYLHLAAADASAGERHVWPFDRAGNKRASVQAALAMAQRYADEGEDRPEGVAAVKTRPLPRLLVVEARHGRSGWQPQAVWLKGRRRRVIGVGRQEETGPGRTELMVELEDGTRLALQVDVRRGEWRLLRAWWPTRMV